MANTESIDSQIIQIIADHAKLAIDVKDLGIDDNLYSSGMTSLSSVNVMLALEDAFDLEFPDRMLNVQVFSCVGSIREAILELTA